MQTIRLLVASTALLLASTSVFAHHSPFTYFDPSKSVETEGTITKVRWRNPHAELEIEAVDTSGEKTAWRLETHSVSILRRMDLDRDMVQVGQRVKVAGWPAKRAGNELFITNLLIEGGKELILHPGAEPRWSDETIGDSSTWLVTEDTITGVGDADGLFHVWSTSLVGGDGNFLYENYDFPLTEYAASARADFDIWEHPILGTCEYKGMPTIMEQPYPMQFAKGHNLILMHMEEGNIVRTFDMTPGADPSALAPTALGHSTGVWEGNDLVVTTINSSWPWIDITGIPISADAVYVERFSPSENGKALNYTLTITDEKTLTRPATFSKQWLWVPDAVVRPYDCVAHDES